MAKKGDGGQAQAKDPAKKLRKLIKGAQVVMMTTVTGEGRFRTRPMIPGAFDEGALWFLTRVPTAKTEDIADNQRVHLAWASPKKDRYVSVSGVATILRDPGHVRDLWAREHKAWFPAGKNDPELAVLRVQLDEVEYWDPAANSMVPLEIQAAQPAQPEPAAPEAPAAAEPRKPGKKQPVSPGALG